MASIDNVVNFEMFLDQETMEAIQTGRVPWYDANDESGYQCDGVDPAIFPGGEVPMKPWSPDHRIALEWFARAHRARRISHPPVYLLMASMPALTFLEHILRGDIVIHSEMSTYGLKKAMNKTHYPDLVAELIKFSDKDAEQMLNEAKTHFLGSKTR